MTAASQVPRRYARRMRYRDDSDAGQRPRRRRSPSGQLSPPAERPAAGAPRASLPEAGRERPGASPSVPGGRHRPTGGSAGKGPLRGFPPAPGQPQPLYPPGQFSAWNRTSRRDGNGSGGTPSPARAWEAPDGIGQAGHGRPGGRHGAPGDGEPRHRYLDSDYSALAVSEPAADFTSTQTWEVLDGSTTGSWAATPPAAASGPLPAVPAGRQRPGSGISDTGFSDTGIDDGPIDDSGVGPAAAVTRRPGQHPGHRAAAMPAGGVTDKLAQAPASRHGTRGRQRPRKRAGRARLLLAAVLAVVVVAGGGVAYLELAGHHSGTGSLKAGASRPKPTADPGPPASLGQWGYITSRTTDPVPLTIAELFPGKFTEAGITYTMTVNKAATSCGPALVGSQLQSAAQQAGCNQAMRASYLSSSSSGQVMGTIGVLNLSTAAGSQSTGRAAGASETIAQLAGPSGPTASLTKGTGLEAAEVKGHYLVLVWAEFANTQSPSTAAQKQQLESFISLLLQKTANVSLAIREVTGKPAS